MVVPGAQYHPQALLLITDGEPAGYDSKFEDLHPESQKILLQLEYASFTFYSLALLLQFPEYT